MASWTATLNTIETACFEYLRQLVGGKFGETCFIGELLDTFADQSEDFVWQFSMTGGNQPLDYDFNMNEPGSCGEQELECEFVGLFNSRPQAREIQGALMDALPTAEYTIENVRRLRPMRHPLLEREIIERAQNQARGGLVRVWSLTYPLEVLFDKSSI
jgi:hypothetical protein